MAWQPAGTVVTNIGNGEMVWRNIGTILADQFSPSENDVLVYSGEEWIAQEPSCACNLEEVLINGAPTTLDGDYLLTVAGGDVSLTAFSIQSGRSLVTTVGETITFTTPFTTPPHVTASVELDDDGNQRVLNIGNITTTGFDIYLSAAPTGSGLYINWIAVVQSSP